MASPDTATDPVPVKIDERVWARAFSVAPLVLVGTIEPHGGHDLAAKHMAMPLGWGPWFCFACSPDHATQRNAADRGAFTVSFPRPSQVVEVSMSAAPRSRDDEKASLAAIETLPASRVDGVLVAGAYMWLECELDRILDGFDRNSLIIGKVVAAAVARDALRAEDVDDAELIDAAPLLAYLDPGRFAEVSKTRSFPYPVNFER